MVKPEDYLDLSKFKHSGIFDGVELVWDVLKKIADYIKENLRPGIEGEVSKLADVAEDVYIGKGTVVEAGAVIKGPAIIGENCEIRKGAYIRGDTIVGDGAILGNSSEFKNAILFDKANVPHFGYVGDSVLGYKAHLGAGVKISNVKLVKSNVVVQIEGKRYDTGLRKFGAIIGDEVEIGCNSVLNPGSMIGKGSAIYPNVSWRGVLPAQSIVQLKQTQRIIERRT